MHPESDSETPTTTIDGVEATALSAVRPLLTFRDVMHYLQLSETSVRRILDHPEGPQTYRVGGSIRVYADDLDSWIRSGQAAEVRVRGSKSSG